MHSSGQGDAVAAVAVGCRGGGCRGRLRGRRPSPLCAPQWIH